MAVRLFAAIRPPDVALDHLEDAIIYALMQRLKEMIGANRNRQLFDNAIVDHYRAQKRGFRFEIRG